MIPGSVIDLLEKILSLSCWKLSFVNAHLTQGKLWSTMVRLVKYQQEVILTDCESAYETDRECYEKDRRRRRQHLRK